VTSISQLFGADEGETLEMVGEAATGITTTHSRSRRPSQVKRGGRFMSALRW
jgi:hypothetical protein